MMWLFFIALFARNIASEFDRWRLGGVIPLDFQIARMPIDIIYIKHEDRPVPDSFDARESWPHCTSIDEIVDQGRCESCWAITSASVMTDRWCIALNKTFIFSAEDLLTCCDECKPEKSANICKSGGYLPYAILFWVKTGVVSGGTLNSGLGCKPYSERTALYGDPPKCKLRCSNPKFVVPYNEDKRHGKRMSIWMGKTSLKQVQIEIMVNGPVCTAMRMNEHIAFSIGDKVYQHPEDKKANFTWHAVKIIGWGVEEGVPYWLVANTWGKEWGSLGGFFKTLRGKNHLGIETRIVAPNVVSGIPKMFSGLPKMFSVKVLGFPANLLFFCLFLLHIHLLVIFAFL